MIRLGDALRGRAVPEPTVPPSPPATECPICRGAGWIRYDVPLGHPSFGQAYPCECLRARQDAERARDLERMSALEPFADWTFDNFDASVPGVADAYQAALEFARDPRGWLVLQGRCGCGKTHLAAAIASERVRRGSRALFTVVPDLLDHLRATFAPTSPIQYDERFESIRAAELLILDDLGTESATPWAQEKLYQIINYRYNYRYPTVITTNRQLSMLDERIESRLSDRVLCKIIELTAADYRPRQAGQRHRGSPGRQMLRQRKA